MARSNHEYLILMGVRSSDGKNQEVALDDDGAIKMSMNSTGSIPSPASAVAGDLLVHNGSNWVRLAKGTDGQVLKMVSGSPAWATDAT